MGALYVTSREEAAGKTVVCAGLANHLKNSGKQAGYLRIRAGGDNGDAGFMVQLLGLEEPAAALTVTGSTEQVREAAGRAARGKDTMIIEGSLGQAAAVARALGARLILVEPHSASPADPSSYREFGSDLLGIMVNRVPYGLLQPVNEAAAARAQQGNTSLLGVLPEDRLLASLTVGELADRIGGKILNNAEKAAELVENYLLGAMVVDSGLLYFVRKDRKAVIVRKERPDMQLAALETPTRCLVLSGNGEAPIYQVQQRAEAKGVPIITTGQDVPSIVKAIENALGKTRFSQVMKMPRLGEIFTQYVNLKAIA